MQKVEERIMAIDFGEVRLGIAITDPLNMFAYPLETIPNNNLAILKLLDIIKNYSVKFFIIGMPIKESGEQTKLMDKIQKFSVDLKDKSGIEFEFYDERYTSKMASQMINESNLSKKKRRDKALIDKTAASIMLQDYLKKIENQSIKRNNN
ncbi:MAG: Holliday junction resolvase RuvX [Ignavibacteriaceae bacterium]|jgi:putative Holliday junction resolvase|nr:Holliday junction resolvase RuvX [Ignavibacteriaceae bacterium]